MSEQINNGGSAFPVHPKAHECGDREYSALAGMTLRDYFAAKAMQALVADYVTGYRTSDGQSARANWRENAAVQAYSVADAMLAARGDA